MLSRYQKEQHLTARVFAEAYERLDAGEYGVREFTRGNVRWVVSVQRGHIEAHTLAPVPLDTLARPRSLGRNGVE